MHKPFTPGILNLQNFVERLSYFEPNPRVEIAALPGGGFVVRSPDDKGAMVDKSAFTNVADLADALPTIFANAAIIKETPK